MDILVWLLIAVGIVATIITLTLLLPLAILGVLNIVDLARRRRLK